MPSLRRSLGPLAAALVILAAAACSKVNDPLGVNQDLPVFNVDLFEANLIAGMGNQAVGWAYAINQNGNLVKDSAFGNARTAADGELAFTTTRRINVASATKLLTAIAVLQLLGERNLTVDSLIAPWLPDDWTRGPGVSALTFADLLSHQSGLNSTNTSFTQTLCYSCLQSVVQEGVTQPTTYNYLNANFALFRVIIPMMWTGLPGGPSTFTPSDASTAATYDQYMQERVFAPIGLTGASLVPDPRTQATLYYQAGDAGTANGSELGDWRAIAGGGGYYMNTLDLARVLAYLDDSQTLVSTEARQVMKDRLLGFDPRSPAFETRGTYHHKNGSISFTNGQGLLIEVVSFHNNVQVAVTVNTQGLVFAFGDSFRQMIYRAFNNAWE